MSGDHLSLPYVIDSTRRTSRHVSARLGLITPDSPHPSTAKATATVMATTNSNSKQQQQREQPPRAVQYTATVNPFEPKAPRCVQTRLIKQTHTYVLYDTHPAVIVRSNRSLPSRASCSTSTVLILLWLYILYVQSTAVPSLQYPRCSTLVAVRKYSRCSTKGLPSPQLLSYVRKYVPRIRMPITSIAPYRGTHSTTRTYPVQYITYISPCWNMKKKGGGGGVQWIWCIEDAAWRRGE